LDDLFAYTAAKSVKIRDARLGILHMSLMFCICLYILVYQLLGHLHYLRFAAAQNTVRLTLQEPTAGGCNPNSPTCKANFVPLGQLPYCCAVNSSCTASADGSCSCDFRPSFANYNCTWLSGDGAAVTQETSILVTTLTHQYSQTLNPSCFADFPRGAGTCEKVWNIDSDALAFTADVEAYTLLLDHSVMLPSSSLAVTSRQMTGLLFVDASADDAQRSLQDQLCASNPDAVDSAVNGQLTSSAPCYLPPQKAQGLDFFPVGTLLQAMGVSLDSESYGGSGHSIRYEGVTTNLVIEYSNTELWRGVTSTRYVYKPSILTGTTYKTTSTVSTQYPGSRIKKDMHGILFQVQPGGELAVFDFTQMLLQLTTSLTLLAMATIGVNLLAQYVLRNRHFYNEALYDRTVDFSHLTICEHLPDAVIEEQLQSRNLPIAGSRHLKILRLMEHGWQPPSATDGSGAGSGDNMARPILTEP